jgi:branched-chain amino acid aminotransferase
MTVFLNGRFVPESEAMVSVLDRGFLYGDGLFEAVRVANGRAFRWDAHLERLKRGADYVSLRLPCTEEALRDWVGELILRNELREGLLRVVLSRGVGPRGYSPRGATEPTLVMTVHPLPPQSADRAAAWSLVTSRMRLPANEALAQFKTCNKLPQVLARAEADAAGADEALLLNTDGHIVESSSGNLFWVADQHVCTPPLASGILAGVTRSIILELCIELGIQTRQAPIAPVELAQTDGVFLSLSTMGVAEAVSLDGRDLSRSPLTEHLRLAYLDLIDRDTR